MRYTFILLLFLTSPSLLFSQRNANVGIFLGTSYYMGDINPNKHFYRAAPSYGLIYRYNLNKHFGVRANGYFAHLSGDEADFPRQYHPDTYTAPASFETSLLDAALQFEFNFFPFLVNEKKWDCTPYIAGGMGYSVIMSSKSSSGTGAAPHFTIPLGIGMKLNITRRLSSGIEWSFRKAFSDRVDGIENSIGIQALVHNNDWYSFAGIFITYKFFNFAVDCPAYSY